MRTAFVRVAGEEEALGEVPLAPYGLTGVSEAQLARGLADRLFGARSGTASRFFAWFPSLSARLTQPRPRIPRPSVWPARVRP
jgi:hypothetical protein